MIFVQVYVESFNMMGSSEFWETEKIGIAITFSCLLMVLFNRVHRYVPYLKCWARGEEMVGAYDARDATFSFLNFRVAVVWKINTRVLS